LSGFDSPERYLNRADYFYVKDENKWQQMVSMNVARESAGMSGGDIKWNCLFSTELTSPVASRDWE